MLIVTGSIVAQPDQRDALLALSLDHVRRSRREPGCLAHDVHRHAEDASRLVFVERWASREALAAHFALDASRTFVARASGLAAAAPEMTIYEATPTRI